MAWSANGYDFPSKRLSRVKYDLEYDSLNDLYRFKGKPSELIKILDVAATDIFFDSSSDYAPIWFDSSALSINYNNQVFFDVDANNNLVVLSAAVTGDCLTAMEDFINYTWEDKVIVDLESRNDNLLSSTVVDEVRARLSSSYVMPDASDNYYTTFGPNGLNIEDASWIIPLQITAAMGTTLHEFSGAHDTLVWNFGDEVQTVDNATATDQGARIITITSTDGWTNFRSFELERPAEVQNFTGLLPNLSALTSLEEVHCANCLFTDCASQSFTSLWHWCSGNNTYLAKPSPAIVSPAITDLYWEGATWSSITMGNWPLLRELRLGYGYGSRTGSFPTITAAAYPNLQQANFINTYYTDSNNIQVAQGLGIQFQGTAITSVPDLASVAPNGNGVEAFRVYGNSSLTTIVNPAISYFGSNTNNVLAYDCALTQTSIMNLLNMLDNASVTNLSAVRLDGGTNWALDASALTLVSNIEARNAGLTILHN